MLAQGLPGFSGPPGPQGLPGISDFDLDSKKLNVAEINGGKVKMHLENKIITKDIVNTVKDFNYVIYGNLSGKHSINIEGALTVYGHITEIINIRAKKGIYTTGNITVNSLHSEKQIYCGGVITTKHKIEAKEVIAGEGIIANKIVVKNQVKSEGNITVTTDITCGDLYAEGDITANTITSTGNLYAGGNITAITITSTGSLYAGRIIRSNTIISKDLTAKYLIVNNDVKVFGNITVTTLVYTNSVYPDYAEKDIFEKECTSGEECTFGKMNTSGEEYTFGKMNTSGGCLIITTRLAALGNINIYRNLYAYKVLEIDCSNLYIGRYILQFNNSNNRDTPIITLNISGVLTLPELDKEYHFTVDSQVGTIISKKENAPELIRNLYVLDANKYIPPKSATK